MFNCFFKNLFCVFLFSFQKRGLAYGVQVFLCFVSIQGYAFLSEVLEVKKQMEGAGVVLESLVDSIKEVEGLLAVEEDYLSYEKELREFQETLDAYERLGLDVKDFVEFRNYDLSSLKGQIDFFKSYIRRADSILKSVGHLVKSPESITATEQIETNRTLRALIEDNQTRELRRLRKEIAKQRLLLERRRKEQEFLNKQYNYINRHSKKKGFGVFHPFQDKKELKVHKRKKFLGIF